MSFFQHHLNKHISKRKNKMNVVGLLFVGTGAGLLSLFIHDKIVSNKKAAKKTTGSKLKKAAKSFLDDDED